MKSLGLLTQTECAAAAAWWSAGADYATGEIEEAWRGHLFNDFHDILPVSCTEPAEHGALELWYDRITLQDLYDETKKPPGKKRVTRFAGKAQCRTHRMLLPKMGAKIFSARSTSTTSSAIRN